MTDNEQMIAEAIARAFETLSERLSKELEDALSQMTHVMERAQKQQYEIMSLFAKQAAAMEALADLVAKVRVIRRGGPNADRRGNSLNCLRKEGSNSEADSQLAR